MNPLILLKALIPGLIPLAIFVGADAIFGETIGLVVGIGTGVVEFAYVLLKDRKADPFVAADTLLLAVAGALSLVLHDAVFFKLKPAIIELVLAVAMGAMLVLPPEFLKGYIGAQLRGIAVPDAALPAMRRSLAVMVGILAAHVALTGYAAIAMSTQAWAFVSQGLLYIVFAVYAVGQLAASKLRAKRASARSSGEEMLPLIDEEGNVVGTAPRSECHKGPGKLHPVVHLQIFDGRGAMYLQKRSASKDLLPGMWDSAVGGHVSAGEDLDAALARELREELGVTKLAIEASGSRIEHMLRYRWESQAESELVFSFATNYGGPFSPDGVEVEEGRFWSFEEIKANLGKGLFTPNFEYEYGLIEKAIVDAARGRAAEALTSTTTGSTASPGRGTGSAAEPNRRSGRGKRKE
jgi:isopentenyldiphosphate isomerase/intracellular septation protein A